MSGRRTRWDAGAGGRVDELVAGSLKLLDGVAACSARADEHGTHGMRFWTVSLSTAVSEVRMRAQRTSCRVSAVGRGQRRTLVVEDKVRLGEALGDRVVNLVGVGDRLADRVTPAQSAGVGRQATHESSLQ